MESIKYEDFVTKILPETKSIIEYAIAFYCDLEKEKLQYENPVSKELEELDLQDKISFSFLLALLSTDNFPNRILNTYQLEREMLCEYIERNNPDFVVPCYPKILGLQDKEEIFSIFLPYLSSFSLDKNFTAENLALLLLERRDSSFLSSFLFSFVPQISCIQKDIEQLEMIPANNQNCLDFVETDSLTKWGFDLMEKEDLQKAYGRESEIRNMEIQLLTPSRKGVILVGEPGVGKRDIVEGLAYDIQNKNVPLELQQQRIIEIDMASLVPGTQFRGEFEGRVKEILDDSKRRGNVILFIENIHKGIHPKEEEFDFVSILGPYLARGDVSLIATSTPRAYDELILANDSIGNKLGKITVKEPRDEVVRQILEQNVCKLEKIFGISFPENPEEREYLLNTVVEMSAKEKREYFSKTCNLDLAKRILERTFAVSRMNDHAAIMDRDLIEAIETDESFHSDARKKVGERLRARQKTSNQTLKMVPFPSTHI